MSPISLCNSLNFIEEASLFQSLSLISIANFLIAIFILLGFLIQTWWRYQWKWRHLISTITMYEIISYMFYFFHFPCCLLLIIRIHIFIGFSLLMQLAFFTTRKVKAMEELTWVSRIYFIGLYFMYKCAFCSSRELQMSIVR